MILVVENLNTDRATMLFSFERHHYEKVLKCIYDYLCSSEINKRSKLRQWNSYGFNGINIKYYAVDHKHTENYLWSNVIKYQLKTM